MNGDRVIRYSLPERVMHWVAALSYVYLLITGLAFYSPRLYWLTGLTGGGPTARAWHPLAGLLFFFSIVWMYRVWRSDMQTTEADRDWNKALLSYVRNEDESVPAVGRFNSGQKQFFWLMLVCGVLLLLSGIVLWFTDSLPWSLRALRYGSALTHVIAFLLTVAGFIVHVYMGIFVVPGGLHGIMHGDVTPAWAKMHHRLWYREKAGAESFKQ